MPRTDIAVLQLLWEIVNQKKGNISRVDFLPQKPAFDLETPLEQPFPRSTPEEQGVDPDFIASLVRDLGAVPSVHMHQMMILRHGHVIYEGGFDPYPSGIWHVTYSMCKSFTNMAIGLLVDSGQLELSDKLVDRLEVGKQGTAALLTGIVGMLGVPKVADITIRDLLTMSSGVAFNETGAISGNKWETAYLESSVKFTPGSKFEYNSMNSYMLSAVVTKITGMPMFDFLKQNIFDPMGIKKIFWESSPTGVTKGGWGMFIMQEDAAKLATLFMQGGIWNGRQLLSRKWVEESTRTQIATGDEENPGYGYHIWTDCRTGSFCFNGMLGQNVHCYPDLDAIVITNAGNAEVFQAGNMTGIIRRYFGDSLKTGTPADADGNQHIFSVQPLPYDSPGERRLQSVKDHMEGTSVRTLPIISGGWSSRTGKGRHHVIRRSVTRELSWQEFFHNYNGRSFRMNNDGIGLFPLIMQIVHTNYTQGISRLTFRYDDSTNVFSLDFTEGGVHHILPVGFTRGRHTAINMNGEDYLVGTRGFFAKNEDGIPVLSLQIAFVEEATERLLKIIFTDPDHIELHWSEAPGDVIITNTLEMITVGSGNTNPLISSILERMNTDLITKSIQGTVQPVVYATAEDVQTEAADAAVPE